ncbi:MAG: nucleoside kinase, partial [Syntrophomonadaceae bacterium]|nr:nucleoside kinase [Syntrophomonadaceae bacterium]
MMPDGTVTVTVKNKGTYYVKPGTTLAELLSDVYDDLKVAAKVDNYLQDLNFVLDRSCSVEAVDLSSENGFRIYRRSVVFMLAKACYDLFPERILVTKNSLSNGLYCEFLGCRPSTEEAAALERHMKELSLKNIPINKLQINVKEAEKHLQRQNQREKVRLLESLPDSAVEIYELEGYYEYTYDFMAVNTGMLKTFRLFEYDAGMILQIPGTKNKGLLKPYKEQKKIASLFNEAKEWAGMLQTPNVAALNDIIRQGGLDEIIRVNEALHEKKFAFIADQICQDENIRLILIAGPS